MNMCINFWINEYFKTPTFVYDFKNKYILRKKIEKKEVRRTRQVANLIAKESVTNKVKREHWHTDNSAKSFTLPVMKYFFKLEFKELYKLKMGSLNFALR